MSTSPHPPTDNDEPLVPEAYHSLAAALQARNQTRPTHALTPHRRPMVIAASAALTAVVVAVALSVVLAASPAGGPVDVLARAEAALPANGELLHYLVRRQGGVQFPGGTPTQSAPTQGCTGAAPAPTEVWQTTTPNRWRAITPTSGACQVVGSTETDPGTAGLETAWAAGTSSTYDRRGTTLKVVTGFSPTSSAAVVPVGIDTVGSGDPISTIRQLLADGDVQNDGTHRAGSREVLRLTGQRTTTNNGITSIDRYVYDVDPESYEPVEITQTTTSSPADTTNRCGPRCRGLRVPRYVQLSFTSYDRYRLNRDTQRLLVIEPPAGTSTVKRTLAELRRADARTRAMQEQTRRRP